MKSRLGIAVVLSLAAGAALKGYGQEKPAAVAAAVRIGVVSIKACYEKDKLDWIKDIDQELQGIADDMKKRFPDLEPKERERLRMDYMEFYGRKKLAVYAELNRLVEVIARERGYGLVLRIDAVPAYESPDAVNSSIGYRTVLYHQADADLTAELIQRLNASYAEKKKKGKEKDF